MRFAHGLRIVLLSCIAFPALAGEGPTVPQEWEGIWSYTTTTRIPCEIGAPMQSTGTDTLCTGDQTFQPQSGVDYTCTGNADADSFEIECTGQVTEGECVSSYVYEASGTRTGETYTSSGTLTVTANDPKVCGFTEFCTDFETVAKRTDTDPESCEGMPVESRSWGRIKSVYR